MFSSEARDTLSARRRGMIGSASHVGSGDARRVLVGESGDG